jgi:putative ABC transport system permease protein
VRLPVIRCLLWRPLRRRPVPFLVTTMGVAVGIASVVSTISSSQAALHAFSSGVDEIAGASRLEVSAPGGVAEEVLGELRPVCRDALVAPVVEEIVRLDQLGDAVRALGVDLLIDRGARELMPQSEEMVGQLQQMLLEPAVLVPVGLARTLGVEAGDSLVIEARARTVQLRIAALVAPPRLQSAWDRVLIIDVAIAQELFGKQGRLDRIELTPRPGVSVEQLQRQVEQLVPVSYRVAPPAQRRLVAEQMVASLRFNLTALSGISLLVGAVLVATTLATSVVRRRYTIALLRSLGASRLQIAGALLTEAGAIGLAGGSVGVIAGIAGARASLASVRTTVASVLRGVPAAEVSLEPWVAVLGVGLAVITALVAAVLPLIVAVQTPPLQGLHRLRPARLPVSRIVRSLVIAACLIGLGLALARLPAWHDLPVPALVGALALMTAMLTASGPVIELLASFGARPLALLGGVVLRMAVAALAAGRRRAAWAAGAVGVAVALAVAIGTMVTSFRATVLDWTEQGMRSDVWVRPMVASTGAAVGRLDPEVVEIAERLFGAGAVDPFYTIDVEYQGRPVTIAGAAFDVVRHHGSVSFVDGRESREVFEEAYQRRAAVVNESFARRFQVGVGDSIRIPVPAGALEREIVGVFVDYSRSQGLAVIDRVDYLAMFPDDGPQELALFLPDEVDAADARNRLLAGLEGQFQVEALLNRELRAEVMRSFDRTFAITTALYLVAAVVAVIAVAAVLLALIGERRRELATVRVIGGSPGQLLLLVLGEAFLLGLVAAAGGIAIGMLIGVILVKVVNPQSFGWSLQLIVPWGSLAAIAGWVVAACALAGLVPAAAAARLLPAEVLREEG